MVLERPDEDDRPFRGRDLGEFRLRVPGLHNVLNATAAIAEEGFDAVQELFLPLADLDGVDLKGPGEFGDGLGLLGRLQGNSGLEGGGMPLAFAGHGAPRDGKANVDQFNIPSGPLSGVHYTQ